MQIMSSHEIPLTIRTGVKIAFEAFLLSTSKGIIVEGKENIPQKPPFIVAFNHMAWTESLLPFILLDLDMWPYTITKQENFKDKNGNHKLLGKILGKLGFYPIARGEADLKALRTSIDFLTKGNVIAIAPEGTRGRDENRLELKEGKSGVIFVATHFEPPIPILPVAIWGQTEEIFPLLDEKGIDFPKDFFKLRKNPIHVKIGQPFIPILEEKEGMKKGEKLNILTTKLMKEIRNLLPEKYHGFYRE